MATREEIYEAIRNAGKAGDGNAVRALGAYLQTMDKQAPDSATEKKTGMLAALGKGTEGVISSSKTALQSVFGDATEAGKQGLERGAKSQYADQIGLDKVKEAYNKDGLLSAAKEVGRQVPLAFAEQAPNLAASLASARLGAMAGSAVGSVIPGLGTGAGALVGGGLGAFAPSLLQQLGGNVERQVSESGEAKLGSAAAAAVPQAALDVAGNYIPLGKQLIGKLLGPEVAAVLNKGGKEAAEKLAKESLLKAAAKGTVVGGAAEIPTEVIQSALERAQAGLPVLSADAYKEYGETAYQASLLAPLGGAGRLYDRAAAKAPVPSEAPADAPINAQREAEEKARAQASGKANVLPENDLFGLASGPNGYAEVSKYKAGLLKLKQTPAVKAAVKEATDLLTHMQVEATNRQREAEAMRANDRGLPTPDTSAFNLPTEESTEEGTEAGTETTTEAEVPPPKVRKRKGAKNVAVPPVVESGETTAIESAGAGATVPSVGVDSQPDANAAAVQTEAAGVGVSELPATDGNAPEGLTGSTVTVNEKPYTIVSQDERKFVVNNGMIIPRTGKLGKAIAAQLEAQTAPAVEEPIVRSKQATEEEAAAFLAEAEPVLAEAGLTRPKETPAVEAPAAIEAPAAPTVESLKAEQEKLRTKSGRVPAVKSKARAKWDALQQQIDDLTPTPPRNKYEPPIKAGLAPAQEKKLRIELAGATQEAKKLEQVRDEVERRLIELERASEYTDNQEQRIPVMEELSKANKAWEKSADKAARVYWQLFDEGKADLEGKIGEIYVEDTNARLAEEARVAKLSKEKQGSYPYNLVSLQAVHDELRDQMSHMPEYKEYIEKYFTVDRKRLKNKVSEKEAIAEGQKLIATRTLYNVQSLDSAVPTPDGFAEAAVKGQTRKALQIVLNHPQADNLTKLVIRSILKAGTLPKLSVVPEGTLGTDTEAKKVRVGEYDPVSDTIRLDEGYVTAANLIHEVMHGFLHRKVADYLSGKHKDAQIKRIDDLFQYLTKNHPELAESYGMTDLSEFVSEAMSNAKFQTDLQAIPYKKGSFFSEFAKAVLKLLGINDTTPKWNALAEALISTESVMQSGRLLQEARTGTAGPQAPKQDTAFKRWFGGSKVVDENGKPLVVFHGTNADIEAFNPDKGYGKQVGMYFTINPETASLFAQRDSDVGSAVYPVYLSIQNPLDLNNIPSTPEALKLWRSIDAAAITAEDRSRLQALGYDGLKSVSGAWIALNPNQIKSAIGNRGTYDPNNPDIRYNISTPGAVAAAASANVIGDTAKRTALDDIKQVIGKISGIQLIDRLRSMDAKLTAGYLGRLRDALGNINPKELLAQALDAPRLVERALVEGFLSLTPDGMFAASEGKLANGERASLKRIVEIIADSAKKAGRSFEEENKVLSAMIVGHREFELDKYNNSPTTPVPIQLRIDDPVKRNELERQFQANASAKKVLEIMDAMRFNRIDMMVYSGRISQDKADFWKSTLGYIPYQDLDRLNERINASKTGSGKGLANTSKFMRLEGNDAQVGNVLDSFVDLMSRMTLDAVKVNAVNRSAEAMRLLGHAKRISPAVSQSQAEKEHTVDTFVNGKPARFYFDDPLDAAAYGALPTSVSSLVQLGQSIARVLRAGVTLVPGFAVGQVLTDLTRAYALSDVSKPAALIPRILMNFPRAAYGEWTGRKSAAVKRLENMGVAATFDVSTQGTIKNIMQEAGAEKRGIVGSILHFAEAISKGSDIAVRKAIYEQSLEETKDEALSISRAREIINFSRRGKNNTVDLLVRMVPFTNAYIRGMDKLYTAATGTSGAYGMTQKQARNMFMGRIGTLAAMGFAYAAMMAGDDEYESLDDSIRDSRIILPFKIDGALASIPLPRDLAFMFKAIPERIVNYVRKYGTEEEQNGMLVIGELMRQGLLTIATPSVIPSAVTPVLENITNKSFFLDRPLESQSQQSIDASLRYGRGTSEVSKEIGNGLAVVAKQFSDMGLDSTADMFKVSPIKIENLLRGWFGTSAALALAMGDSMLAPERTAKSPHKEVLAQLTGLSAMMTDPVGRKQLNEFYDLYDKTSEFKKSLSKLEKTDPEAAIKYGRERVPEMEVADYMEILHKDIQELNATIRLIDSDKDMTADQKLKAVSEIVREQNEIAKATKSIKRHLLKRE